MVEKSKVNISVLAWIYLWKWYKVMCQLLSAWTRRKINIVVNVSSLSSSKYVITFVKCIYAWSKRLQCSVLPSSDIKDFYGKLWNLILGIFHAIPIENPFICNTSVYKYTTCECKGFYQVYQERVQNEVWIGLFGKCGQGVLPREAKREGFLSICL